MRQPRQILFAASISLCCLNLLSLIYLHTDSSKFVISLPTEIPPQPITTVTTTYQPPPVEIWTFHEPILGESKSSRATVPAISPSTTVYSGSKESHITDDIWWQLALCEDGGRNRYYEPYSGYFHFLPSTWWGIGGPSGYPHEYDYSVQKHWAQVLQSMYGWGQWPGCKAKLGL